MTTTAPRAAATLLNDGCDFLQLYTIDVTVDGLPALSDWGNGPTTLDESHELLRGVIPDVEGYVPGSLAIAADGLTARAEFDVERGDLEQDVQRVAETYHLMTFVEH